MLSSVHAFATDPARGAYILGFLAVVLGGSLGLGKISVGAPYFNAVFVPIMAVLVFFMGIGPLTRWKNDELPALVLFTAPWCGPCRLTSPVVGEILAQYRGRIRVLEMSTDDLPEVAMDAGVRSIPTILIYHGGTVRDTIVGCVARNVLARAVDKVLEGLGGL